MVAWSPAGRGSALIKILTHDDPNRCVTLVKVDARRVGRVAQLGDNEVRGRLR